MTFSATDWLTLALVAITGIYAWATFKILRANEAVVHAMQEQTQAQVRPYVVVSASPRIGTTLLLLEIQNTGKSPATALRLTMDRDFFPHAERRENENIAKLPAFTEPIESLAPGARLVFILGSAERFSERKQTRPFAQRSSLFTPPTVMLATSIRSGARSIFVQCCTVPLLAIPSPRNLCACESRWKRCSRSERVV